MPTCPQRVQGDMMGLAGKEGGHTLERDARSVPPVVLRVEEAVDITAPPARVYALVSDPAAKARLNPFIQAIRIEREDPGRLRVGSVTLYRLQKGTRIFEYRMRCIRHESGRLIESQAELPTLFTVRMEVEAIPGGSRLLQREACEITASMLDGLQVPPRAERAWRAIKILSLLAPSLARETFAVILRERADVLRVAMERELRGWLLAIKQHLESGQEGRSVVR